MSRPAHGAVAVLVLVALVCSAAAQFSSIETNATGYFYFYSSGQIVVISPQGGRVWNIIKSSNATDTPFPNRCPNSQFKGDWVDVSFGPGKRTLISSIAYNTPAASRSHDFPDGLMTVDIASSTAPDFTALDAAPHTTTFVPTTGKLFVTSSGSGPDTQSLGVLSSDSSFPLELSIGLPAAGPLGSYAKSSSVPPGKLVHAQNLGGQAYYTSPIAAGVYSIDLYHKNVKPDALSPYSGSFISFAKMGCQATGGAVYSRLLRQAFFLCTEKAPQSLSNKLAAAKPQRGLVQLDATTNTPIRMLPYTGDKIYVTPDESFLVILNSAAKTIYMLQFNTSNGAVVPWNPIPMTNGYTPLEIVFAFNTPYYTGYISYADVDRMGILDFGRVLQCGLNCDPGNSASFIQDQQQMGFHNPPTDPEAQIQGLTQPNFVRQTSRAIGAGGGFVCQAANFEMAVYCFSPKVGAPVKFSNISYTQHIRFVPASIANYPAQMERINPYFDCNPSKTDAGPMGDGSDGGAGAGFQDYQAAPPGLSPSFRLLATMYAALAIVAFLYGF